MTSLRKKQKNTVHIVFAYGSEYLEYQEFMHVTSTINDQLFPLTKHHMQQASLPCLGFEPRLTAHKAIWASSVDTVAVNNPAASLGNAKK